MATTDASVNIGKSGKGFQGAHWIVLGLSLLLTLFAWHFSRGLVEERAHQRFERDAAQAIELIRERMEKYEDALRAGVGFIGTNGGDVSLERWRSYAGGLELTDRYPGINGIGVIHYVRPADMPAYLSEQRRTRPGFGVHPPHGESEFWPITYIEPSNANARPSVSTSPTRAIASPRRGRRATPEPPRSPGRSSLSRIRRGRPASCSTSPFIAGRMQRSKSVAGTSPGWSTPRS